MGYVWLLVILALGVSLFNYFDSKDLKKLTVTAFAQRNKKYGAYTMSRDYGHIMLVIVASLSVICVFSIGTQKDFWMGGELPEMKQQYFDTITLSLDTPPEELEPTLPPSYTIKSEEGSGGQEAADQEAKEEVKKTPDSPDTPRKEQPQKETQEPQKETPEKIITDPRDPEYYRNAGSKAIADAKARADARKQKEEQRRQDAMKRQGQDVKGQNGQEGSVPKTQPMVDFSLSGRTPYNNDDYWVRNPGYTCGKGEGGTVIVAIKVNSNGNVIDAVPTGNHKSLDQCIVQRAIEYAKMSRFNASSKAVQEGTITYKYKPQ
jgi:hypothetical protein